MSRRIVVDGYNVIHAWPELARVMRSHNLEEARRRLIRRLAEHHASTGDEVIVVFDSGAGVKSATVPERIDGVEVRFGSAMNSADHIIERLAYEAARAGTAESTVIVSNDNLQRDMVRAMGVAAMGAEMFRGELVASSEGREGEIKRHRDTGEKHGRVEERIPPSVRERLERMRRGDDDSGA
jgi:predicted RNA-binding protein with PIN domain